MNRLHYGDNLNYLREMPGECVDLVYLDPPFNSQSTYNLLFRTPEGDAVQAQTAAFQDTWWWDRPAEEAFADVLASGSAAGGILRALRGALGTSDMMAYLAMMTVRLLELRRVMRPEASLYLHCDPTASHYLKILMDAAFGADHFGAELVWRRTNARGTRGNWPHIHDTILYFRKGRQPTFHSQKARADKAKLPHTLITGQDGRKYQTFELTAPGATKEGQSGKPWRGHDPGKWGRHWANRHEQMEAWDSAGLIHWPRNSGFPRRRAEKPFVAEDRMVTVGDVWTDIDRLNQSARERLGYPTQKPLGLLERILTASSNPGDVVLDPFCGCGTTIEAAERLGRRWLGIDVTHHAIEVIEGRLAERCPKAEYRVTGRPEDLAAAHDLARRDKYEFQWWANWLVGVQNYLEYKKGADKGIDGLIYFRNGPWGVGQIIVSVKGGRHVGPDMIASLLGTVTREEAALGIFICLAEPTPRMRQDAAAAGFVRTAQGSFPRIQIITIETLLAGKRPDIPDPIESAAFNKPLRRPRPAGSTAPAPEQYNLPLPLTGGGRGKADVRRHLSGRVIGGLSADLAGRT